MTTQFLRLFDVFRIAKCNKVVLLHNRLLLQTALGITKCVSYYNKVRRKKLSNQLIEIKLSVITLFKVMYC